VTETVAARQAPSEDRVGLPATLAAVVGALFGFWGFTIGLAALGDNGFFTHLATGRLMLLDGIPRLDPYSFTVPGEPWVVQSWLASLVYAGVERLGGAEAIRLLVGLSTGLLALLAWRLTHPAKGLIVRVVATALVIGIGTGTWTSRPLLFGLVFLCITLLVAQRQLPAPLLLPVYWLWVNTHGSFPLGIVALVLLALGARFDGGKPDAELRGLKWAVGGTLLGVVNPLGLTLLTFPVHMIDRQDLLSQIIEWQSPKFSTTWARLFLVLVALAVAALARRPSWRAALIVMVFVPAALLAARNVSVASLVLLPGIAYGLSGVGRLDGLRRSRAATVGVGAVVVLAIAFGARDLQQPSFDFRDFPVDAVAYLDQAGLVGPGSSSRIAADDRTGNFLELLYAGDARVFLDDRLDMFPEGVVEDYLTLRDAAPGWQEVFARREIDLVLWPRVRPLTQVLLGDPAWQLVYTDPDWVVFVPR
jgi:hypothetical protein